MATAVQLADLVDLDERSSQESLLDTKPEIEIPVIEVDEPPPLTNATTVPPVDTRRTFATKKSRVTRSRRMADAAGNDVPQSQADAGDRSTARAAAFVSTDDHEAEVGNEAAGPSDARLVEATRRGDQDAFGTLVRRYERRLSRVIGRFIQDADLNDDLTQETFLRVFERLEQFDASRRFGPWLFRVGVNLTLDHLRKKKRRKWTALFSEQPSAVRDGRSYDPGAEDPRDAEDLKQEVRHVLEDVPEKYRTVLVLRDLENFSTSEIAAILDRKEATIRWRLAEARSRFEALWTKRQQAAER